MIISRRMHIRNTAYIPPNWKDIRIAYMRELAEIPRRLKNLRRENHGEQWK